MCDTSDSNDRLDECTCRECTESRDKLSTVPLSYHYHCVNVIDLVGWAPHSTLGASVSVPSSNGNKFLYTVLVSIGR